MEELYVEGVATHGGPESCVVVCEGGVEALTGARAGRAIELSLVAVSGSLWSNYLAHLSARRGFPGRSGRDDVGG